MIQLDLPLSALQVEKLFAFGDGSNLQRHEIQLG